jgi:hypothetical protein
MGIKSSPELFQRVWRSILRDLKYYSLTDPIAISCDASQSGLECVLMQNGKPVAFGSKALTHAEYAYAQIEKELLTLVFAIKKFDTYV